MQNQQKFKFRKDDFIMKKFKKIIAMGCATVMAISAMSISAFAEIVTPLPGGGEFVIYEEGDKFVQTYCRFYL